MTQFIINDLMLSRYFIYNEIKIIPYMNRFQI